MRHQRVMAIATEKERCRDDNDCYERCRQWPLAHPVQQIEDDIIGQDDAQQVPVSDELDLLRQRERQQLHRDRDQRVAIGRRQRHAIGMGNKF